MKEKLLNERDTTIRLLWSVFNKLSYEIKVKDWTDEDLQLWTKITSHSSIQNKLNTALKEGRND